MSEQDFRIFVGGLVEDIQDEDLINRFSPYGTICGVELKSQTYATGEWMKSFAFVNLRCDRSSFSKCLEKLNNSSLKGGHITLQQAREDRFKRMFRTPPNSSSQDNGSMYNKSSESRKEFSSWKGLNRDLDSTVNDYTTHHQAGLKRNLAPNLTNSSQSKSKKFESSDETENDEQNGSSTQQYATEPSRNRPLFNGSNGVSKKSVKDASSSDSDGTDSSDISGDESLIPRQFSTPKGSAIKPALKIQPDESSSSETDSSSEVCTQKATNLMSKKKIPPNFMEEESTSDSDSSSSEEEVKQTTLSKTSAGKTAKQVSAGKAKQVDVSSSESSSSEDEALTTQAESSRISNNKVLWSYPSSKKETDSSHPVPSGEHHLSRNTTYGENDDDGFVVADISHSRGKRDETFENAKITNSLIVTLRNRTSDGVLMFRDVSKVHFDPTSKNISNFLIKTRSNKSSSNTKEVKSLTGSAKEPDRDTNLADSQTDKRKYDSVSAEQDIASSNPNELLRSDQRSPAISPEISNSTTEPKTKLKKRKVAKSDKAKERESSTKNKNIPSYRSGLPRSKSERQIEPFSERVSEIVDVKPIIRLTKSTSKDRKSTEQDYKMSINLSGPGSFAFKFFDNNNEDRDEETSSNTPSTPVSNTKLASDKRSISVSSSDSDLKVSEDENVISMSKSFMSVNPCSGSDTDSD